MIDTTTLCFDEPLFSIKQPERFSPNAELILKVQFLSKRVRRATLNPSKREQEQVGYLPRLTLTRQPRMGGHLTQLYVELSLPKLALGNNWQELCNSDFKAVIDRLHDALEWLGVLITKEVLRQASVAKIHFGKNIALPRHCLCSSLIGSIAKVPHRGGREYTQAQYANDGSLFRVHTKAWELVFYDKGKECQKEARTLPSGLDNLLRIEYRLNTKAAVMSGVSKYLPPDTLITFESLFSHSVAMRVLQAQWEPYAKALPMLMLAERETSACLMGRLQGVLPHAKQDTLLKLYALWFWAGAIGWAAVKAQWRGSPRTLSTLKKQLEAAQSTLMSQSYPFAELKAVHDALNAYKPIRMDRIDRCKPLKAVAQ